MKRKFEDKLAMLAFGDLSVEESAALERRASEDPEMAGTLREFRELREGLRQLGDVPDHQLSTERLRSAILGDGLRPPREQASPWAWLWMPAVSCAAVAILLIAFRPRSNGQVEIVGAGHLPELVKSRDIALKVPGPSNPIGQDVLKSGSAGPSVTHGEVVAVNTDKPVGRMWNVTSRHYGHGRRGKRPAAVDPTLVAWMDGGEFGSEGPSTPSGTVHGPNPDTAASAVAEMPVKPSGGLVVIDTDKDGDTGAQKATEVGSGKNVVIGG